MDDPTKPHTIGAYTVYGNGDIEKQGVALGNLGDLESPTQKVVKTRDLRSFHEKIEQLLDDGWAITPHTRYFYDLHNCFCIVEKTDG